MTSLQGKQILVVEDDYVIALMARDMIKELGGIPVGPAGSVIAALQCVRGTALDGALLDRNLNGEESDAVACALARNGVPYVVTSGYDPPPRGPAGPPYLRKPYSARKLRDALQRLFQRGP